MQRTPEVCFSNFVGWRRLKTRVLAVLEWVIAFGFTLYLLTFYYDLRLSKNVEKGELKALAHPSRTNVQNLNARQMAEIA